MAMNFMKSMGSAFDRMGQGNDTLGLIEQNTASVAIGGDLYTRIDELVTAIVDIKDGKSKSGASDIKQALALAIVAPAIGKVGMGLQYVVDAINSLEGTGKEVSEKTEALIGGLTKLGDVGKSILMFAGYMILAAPFLLVAAAISPLIALTLFMITAAVTMSTKNLDEKTMEKLDNLTGVGLGILTIVGTLALTSLIIMPALKGLLAVLIIVPAMMLILRIAGALGGDKAKETADTLVMTGLGILSVMVALALTSLIAPFALKGAMFAGMAILAIGAVFFLLDKLGVVDSMEQGGKALLFIAGAILGLGIALALFNIIAPPMTVLLEIALVVGAVGLTFGIIGVMDKFIKKGAQAMLWASLSILVLGLSLLIFSKVIGNISGEEAVKSLGALLLIGLIGAAFYLAGTQATFIALGAGAMILVGIALIINAVAIKILGNALGDDGWSLIGQSLALIGGLGVAFGLAGVAAPFIALGAGAMILAGGALILVGAGMLILKKLNFDQLTKKTGVLGDSGQKTTGFMGIGGGRPKTNMEVMFEAIANSFSLGPLQLAAMYVGAPALIMAGMALTSIAFGIKQFQKIAETADLKSLGVNVASITFALSDTFGKIGKMYPGGKKSLFSSIFGGGSQSAVADGISSVLGMGGALTSIAKGVQAMAELKFPTGYDKEGNATGYETINLTSAVPALIANTKLIVAGLSSVFAEVGESDAAQGSSWFTSSSYEKGIKVVNKMGEPLYNLANGVQNMANLKFPTGYDKDGNATGYKTIGDVGSLIKKIAANTKALIIGLAGVFEEVGKSDAADTSWFSANNFEKGVWVANSLAEPYSALAGTVQDVSKITSGISDAKEVKDKVTAMISAITDAGGDDSTLIVFKTRLINQIGKTYEKLGVAIPLIVSSIAAFTVDKAKAFASIFGGESPPELFESKSKFLNQLTGAYLRMALAIPMIVGSINQAQAEPLAAFTSVYGGSMINVDNETLQTRTNLFVAAGNSYEKMGQGAKEIIGATNGANLENLTQFKSLFVGRVSMLRPIAGYNAQTELWNAIGTNMTATAVAFPQISAGINSMELEKLTEARAMFEALAVLAEGGDSPEDILESMGSSLEEALNNLAQMLEDFKSTVQEQGVEQQGILSKIAAVPGQLVGGMVGGVVDGLTGRGGGGSGDVVAAVKSLQSALTSQGIKVKTGSNLGR